MLAAELPMLAIQQLLECYGLKLVALEPEAVIPGSYWGEAEAGIIGRTIYIRPDTPVHSLLHETCHVICMDEERRQKLHTDAGGETSEEDAVCYLQILLADEFPAFGKVRALLDMDRWGYTFRLGSAQRWFEEDAEDARLWLLKRQLIDSQNRPNFILRSS
jgi:hypothetical protein